jgi:hypothetical protein
MYGIVCHNIYMITVKAGLEIKAEITKSGKKIKDIADLLGVDYHYFAYKLRNDKITYAEAMKIADLIGKKILWVEK